MSERRRNSWPDRITVRKRRSQATAQGFQIAGDRARLLTRRVGERQIVVKVLEDGFEYESRRYRSLSAIAREVTGTRGMGSCSSASRSGGMPNTTPIVRCAIYTRKSTEEGLDQEFNSLHAQREAAEAFIQSQKHAGWTLVPRHYDDGGFTGGNLDRPALQRLLEDIDDRRVDCVVVYKVDRLSRSLLDFARLVDRFDQRSVSFVSVTQQFNTTTSLGTTDAEYSPVVRPVRKGDYQRTHQRQDVGGAPQRQVGRRHARTRLRCRSRGRPPDRQ